MNESLLIDAWNAYFKAIEELRESFTKRDLMLLRNACEKGWLAIVKATDALLEGKGLGRGESYKERRDKLWRLSMENDLVNKLGLYDRFGARESNLHIHGFYNGIIDWDIAKEELRKVEKCLRDVEEVLK